MADGHGRRRNEARPSGHSRPTAAFGRDALLAGRRGRPFYSRANTSELGRLTRSEMENELADTLSKRTGTQPRRVLQDVSNAHAHPVKRPRETDEMDSTDYESDGLASNEFPSDDLEAVPRYRAAGSVSSLEDMALPITTTNGATKMTTNPLDYQVDPSNNTSNETTSQPSSSGSAAANTTQRYFSCTSGGLTKYFPQSEMDSVEDLQSVVHDFRIPHGQRQTFVHRLCYDTALAAVPVLGENGNPIDFDDHADPQMCAEYADEIFDYMYDQQERYMVDPASMAGLPASFRWESNRPKLVNWLVGHHRRFRLVSETLYLAVNTVDRFLRAEGCNMVLGEIQLLGATALFLAAKYEEVMTPTIENFATIAGLQMDQVDEVRTMERRILVTIGFDLGAPSPLNYLRRISRADDFNVNIRTLAKFLMEIVLLEPRLFVYRPSDVAAGAMYASRQILGEPEWTTNFIVYSGGCTGTGLQPIVEIMRDYLRGPCETRDEDFIAKYMSKKHMHAASISIEWARS